MRGVGRGLCGRQVLAGSVLVISVSACAHQARDAHAVVAPAPGLEVAGEPLELDSIRASVPSDSPPHNAHLMNPADVVQAQLEAYNRRDLPAFLATFAANVELYTLGETAPSATGQAELKRIYGELFAASPELHSEILHRAVVGPRVLDHERITGRRGSNEALELVMVYEVEGGLIRRAWAIRP